MSNHTLAAGIRRAVESLQWYGFAHGRTSHETPTVWMYAARAAGSALSFGESGSGEGMYGRSGEQLAKHVTSAASRSLPSFFSASLLRVYYLTYFTSQ